MDLDAKIQLEDISNDEDFSLVEWKRHKNAFPAVQVKGVVIDNEITKNVYRAITDIELLKYWVDKGRFQEAEIANIDWRNQERAIKVAGLTRNRFVTKWACDLVASGKNMQRWKMRHMGNCPFCMEEKEDVQHILHCAHKDAKDASKQA